MNRSYFALFVALLIHLLLLLLFLFLGSMKHDIKKSVEPKENKIKISLKEMPKRDKEPTPAKEQPKPLNEKMPAMPHGKQLKEMNKQTKSEPAKKEFIKFEPKETEKKPQTTETPKKEQTPEPTPTKEVLPKKEAYIHVEPKKPKDPLAWMSEDRSSEVSQQQKSVQKNGSSINSSIKELYGEEFSKLTAGQQKYIIDNQEVMRRITQEVLTRVARVNIPREFNANRINVIEFYLHPNGDMSDFKFLKNSGYYILDDTTKETIEYAYSRYPRPTEKILIRYNVYYNMGR